MVTHEATEYWASLCGLIALIQSIPASVSLSEKKKYSAHHATNTLAYAIQKVHPRVKREKGLKGCTARIVPNDSAFRKRNWLGWPGQRIKTILAASGAWEGALRLSP
jgi:hypothetical protein